MTIAQPPLLGVRGLWLRLQAINSSRAKLPVANNWEHTMYDQDLTLSAAHVEHQCAHRSTRDLMEMQILLW